MKTATGHFSRASGMTVWLVKARQRVVIDQAWSQDRPRSSISRRISSETAHVGCVSFIWKMAASGSESQLLPAVFCFVFVVVCFYLLDI